MADNFRVFPNSKQEALALEYIKAQDLSDKTPEEIAVMYDDAYSKIRDAFKKMLEENKKQHRKESLHMDIL